MDDFKEKKTLSRWKSVNGILGYTPQEKKIEEGNKG